MISRFNKAITIQGERTSNAIGRGMKLRNKSCKDKVDN